MYCPFPCQGSELWQHELSCEPPIILSSAHTLGLAQSSSLADSSQQGTHTHTECCPCPACRGKQNLEYLHQDGWILRGRTALEGQHQQLACSLFLLSSQGLLSECPRESNHRHTAVLLGTYVPLSITLRLFTYLLQGKFSPGIPFSGFLRIWSGGFGGFVFIYLFVCLFLVFFKKHSLLAKWKFSWINAVIKQIVSANDEQYSSVTLKTEKYVKSSLYKQQLL